MKLQEVKAIAKQKGIDPERMKKDELIKAMQRAEGNNDCFGTALSIECGHALLGGGIMKDLMITMLIVALWIAWAAPSEGQVLRRQGWECSFNA